MKRNLASCLNVAYKMGCLLVLASLAACSSSTHYPVPTQRTDIAAYNPQDYGYAYNYFNHYAQEGNAIAEDNLGKMYADGRGVTANPTQSVAWFSKAAAQHNGDAELNLGVACLYGRGIAQNTDQACQLFADAKRDGSPYAQDFIRNNC